MRLIMVIGLLVPSTLFAQTRGKIAGTVVSAETVEPVPGATVVIVGTQLGTATNARGEYSVENIPPGSYDVRASFVGMQTHTNPAIRVSAGHTTHLDFKLIEEEWGCGPVVEYVRPPIALGPRRIKRNPFVKAKISLEPRELPAAPPSIRGNKEQSKK